ncbi:MAG TPA: hypothetical protein VFC93_03460 [Chloroflexota bacterium]|nr:hypothetical protein [Chloroflexota bacterium]
MDRTRRRWLGRLAAAGAVLVAVAVAGSGSPRPTAAARVDAANRLYLPALQQDLKEPPCAQAPALISPPDGAQLDTRVPLLQWDGNNPNARVLYVYIAADPEFRDWDRIRPADPRGFAQQYWPRNLEPGTTYWWRAMTNCGLVSSPYSPTRTFTTGSVGFLPDVPTLVAPDDRATLPSTGVTLRWTAVPGAVDYARFYHPVIAATSPDYQVTPETEATLPALIPGLTYEWWVTARSPFGYGGDAPSRRFTVSAAPSARLRGLTIQRPPSVVFEHGSGPPPP